MKKIVIISMTDNISVIVVTGSLGMEFGPMKSVDAKILGNNLTITVDLSKSFGLSRSGKAIIIGSTEGNEKLDGSEVHVGVTAYKYEK